MSSAGDALRAGVLLNPDDDTVRLVYADWLEENGEPERGGFVRAQVWAALGEPYSPAVRQHLDTARKLFEGRGASWAAAVRRFVLQWQFARGFVEHVAVDVTGFPLHATELFALEPIRSLKPVRNALADPPAELDDFLNVPQLARVTRLDLANLNLGPHEFDQLLACPHLAHVTDLSLRGNRVLPDWLTTLLVGPAFPALAGLDLADLAHLGPRLAAALPRVRHRALKRANFDRVVFGSDDMTRVLNCACLKEVEELRLAWIPGTGRPGPLTHLHLGWALPWRKLRLLDVSGQGVGSNGIVELTNELNRAKEPVPLRWLNLANNRIGADGVTALVKSDPSKLNLYFLDVRGNGLTLAQRAALQSRFADAVIEA
jgi:uncharacterized protein (TIGR02996 family)